MTTVAWDGRMLAADSRTTRGSENAKIMTPKLKIYVYGNKAISGAGGSAALTALAMEYAKNGRIATWTEDFADTCLIIVEATGAKILTQSCLEGDPWDKIEAAGSGSEFAEGCMRSGVNAHKAVEKTAQYDVHTGDGIYSISLQQLKQLPSDFKGYWQYTYQDDIRRILRDYRTSRLKKKWKNNSRKVH